MGAEEECGLDLWLNGSGVDEGARFARLSVVILNHDRAIDLSLLYPRVAVGLAEIAVVRRQA